MFICKSVCSYLYYEKHVFDHIHPRRDERTLPNCATEVYCGKGHTKLVLCPKPIVSVKPQSIFRNGSYSGVSLYRIIARTGASRIWLWICLLQGSGNHWSCLFRIFFQSEGRPNFLLDICNCLMPFQQKTKLPGWLIFNLGLSNLIICGLFIWMVMIIEQSLVLNAMIKQWLILKTSI